MATDTNDENFTLILQPKFLFIRRFAYKHVYNTKVEVIKVEVVKIPRTILFLYLRYRMISQDTA